MGRMGSGRVGFASEGRTRHARAGDVDGRGSRRVLLLPGECAAATSGIVRVGDAGEATARREWRFELRSRYLAWVRYAWDMHVLLHAVV